MPARYILEEKPQFYIEGGGGKYTQPGGRSTKKAAIALAEKVRRETPVLRPRRVVDTKTRTIIWSDA